jgi:hypothetical protein
MWELEIKYEKLQKKRRMELHAMEIRYDRNFREEIKPKESQQKAQLYDNYVDLEITQHENYNEEIEPENISEIINICDNTKDGNENENEIIEMDGNSIINEHIVNNNNNIIISSNNIWKGDEYKLFYSMDSYKSCNKNYDEVFDIGKEIKKLLDTFQFFNKPNDYDDKIHDYSEQTIGEFMKDHRELMLRNNMSEVEGNDVMNFSKRYLPISNSLLLKTSYDSKFYVTPPLVLKYDICFKKGCNVFVGYFSSAHHCNSCNSRRRRTCTKINCILKKRSNYCNHIRPALKQVNIF